MKVYISINDDVGLSLTSKHPLYGSSSLLIDEFVRQGHDVSLVHPTEIFQPSGQEGIVAVRTFSSIDGMVVYSAGGPVEGDLFFIRSTGRGRDQFYAVHEALQTLEQGGMLVLNDTQAARVTDKQWQRTHLSLPFIPGYTGLSLLRDIQTAVRDSPDGIIAKPQFGFKRGSVHYLQTEDDAAKVFDGSRDPLTYNFEHFVADPVERRMIILDGELVATREVRLKGAPAQEHSISSNCHVEPTADERAATMSAAEQLGLFYGGVDFRGYDGKIMEINGSALGVRSSCDFGDDSHSYSLEKRIVDAALARLG